MPNLTDFDRMFAEMRAETIPFRAYGKLYRIPGALPARLVLELARHEADENLPPRLVLEAAETIFGPETLAELCAHDDFSLPRLERMLEWAFSAINGPAPREAGGPGN